MDVKVDNVKQRRHHEACLLFTPFFSAKNTEDAEIFARELGEKSR